MLDNYDSFTYNLVQYLGELGAELEVARNDKTTVADVLARQPDGIVVSPGPCTPNEAGVSCEVIRRYGPRIPILGVCLGHQCIGAAYGARVVRAAEIMHGKMSDVTHDSRTIYRSQANPFPAMRYHSLVLDPESLPDELSVSARTADGVIMGVRHQRHPVEGVQFHPESILAEGGKTLLKDFLECYA